MWNGWKSLIVLLAVFLALGQVAHAADIQIGADSQPYRFDWSAGEGTLVRHALNDQPQQQWTLSYLHTDPGPQGYSKHLAWFLARNTDGFALLWCYLNDNGHEFWCWLYTFPNNQLTTLRFVGDYQFSPPLEPLPSTLLPTFGFQTVPPYTGLDFVYRNWTRRSGTLDRLSLWQAKTGASANPLASGGTTPPGDKAASSPIPPGSPARILKQLRVFPLHVLNVGAANGWRAEGWRELHTLAADADNNPYYLILYSNSARGYVVDLRRSQTYIADFGETVRFGSEATNFGMKAADTPSIDLNIRRGERHEVTLLSSETHANPYTDVLLEADVRTPGGERLIVPGFWDGTNTWRIRFTPSAVGTWTWRTRSNDTSLNGQTGTFECVAEDAAGKGFLKVNPTSTESHHFVWADGPPFFPMLLHESVHHITDVSGPKSSVITAALPQAGKSDVPATFAAFRSHVDACVALGINRFVGGYLLDKPGFFDKTQKNEGGAPFTEYDLDRLNPAYFQWMDRRIAYCNQKGIVPDIGLTWLDANLTGIATDAQLRRLWRYTLARYASYDICWNLFGRASATGADKVDERVQPLAELTRLYDAYHHPITMVTADPPPPPAVVPQPAPDAMDDFSDDLSDDFGGPGALPPPTPPVTSHRKKKKEAPKPPPSAPYVTAPWQDVITLIGNSSATISQNWQFSKPILFLDAGPANSDTLRRQMWEARMRGGYWIETHSANDLDAPETRWLAYQTRFFGLTRYWRLEPHPDMVGRPEDPRLARRRKRAMETSGAPPMSPPDANAKEKPASAPAGGPIFVLADPAWEYVVYFTKGGTVTLDLIEATGGVNVGWFNPRTGQFANETRTEGGTYATFVAPDSNDWVLYISRR